MQVTMIIIKYNCHYNTFFLRERKKNENKWCTIQLFTTCWLMPSPPPTVISPSWPISPGYILLICYMEYPSGQLGPPVLSSCHTSSLIEHEAFKSAGFKTSTAQKLAEHPPAFYQHYSHTESKIQLLGRKFTGLQLKSGHRNPLYRISVYFL